jgi:hypothetical protein
MSVVILIFVLDRIWKSRRKIPNLVGCNKARVFKAVRVWQWRRECAVALHEGEQRLVPQVEQASDDGVRQTTQGFMGMGGWRENRLIAISFLAIARETKLVLF